MDTFVETKKVIRTVLDGDGPGYSYISVGHIEGEPRLDIVIGAQWHTRSACSFNKASLTQLIEILTEIRDALDEE